MTNEVAVPGVKEETQGGIPTNEKPKKVAGDPLLSEWWDQLLIKSKNTASMYTKGLLDLLNTLQISQAKELRDRLENRELDPYRMFSSWVVNMVNRKFAPKTIAGYVHGAKGFISCFCDKVELDKDKFRVRVSLPRLTAMTQDRIPEKEQLDLLFNLAGLKGRVTLLILVHGMRIGEAAQLRPGDLKLADRVPHVALRPETTKGKQGRLVPLTPQAVALLRQYLALNKSKGEYLVTDTGDPSQIRIWMQRLLKRAKMDERDNRTLQRFHVFHPHTLRKYAKTYMSIAHVEGDFSAAILGHRNYLNQEYFRANLNYIANEFRKVIPHLTLGTGAIVQAEKTKLDEKIEKYRREGITDDQMLKAMESCFYFQVRRERISRGDVKPTPNALPFLMELVEALIPGGVDGVIERLRGQRDDDS